MELLQSSRILKTISICSDKLCKISVALKNLENTYESPLKIHTLHYEFAPIISCAVEKSFSVYKNILFSKKDYFTGEHITKCIL